jgi:crotonobetainyl-CoA:carnitine CoA-transferase CaiB-like acyl-CoA transferase
VFSARPLEHWLALFDGEDVCVGPVATPAEAAAEFATPAPGAAPALGEHTAAWRRDLGL